ncbi:pseudouridine synthase [Lacrimispora sp. JR3]|uniref:pseudouridine synthase n=1 Tax=Lacrimispora sinapis TaxID=3111456 RepID=UPI0037478254
MEAEGIRLNKFLSEAGICSRREADRLIEAGKVRIDGQAASTGQKVLPGQTVLVNGRIITAAGGNKSHKEKPVLLAVYKPKGIVCTTSHKDRAPNIVDMIDYPVRIYPVGRLDKDSEGLILMTNQGELVNKIMRSGNAHEKEYLVKVNRPVTDDFIRKLKKGVFLSELDVTTKPCFAAKTGEKAFKIVLTQGLNRQIRRMCGELGYEVRLLKRMRIMNVELGDLKPGAYRELSKREYHQMKEALKGSSNLSYKEQKKELSDGRQTR